MKIITCPMNMVSPRTNDRTSEIGGMQSRSIHEYALRLLITICLLVPITGSADENAIEPFVGVYEGVAVTDPAGMLTPRDIWVKIRQEREDFIVDWHSVVTDGDTVRRHNHEVHFQPSARHMGEYGQQVYREALRPSVSGTSRPSDPMQGESVFWARLGGETLTIYRMRIRDDGSQDLQIFQFILVGNRMHLKFKHMRDDQLLQSVAGILDKQATAP